MRIDKKSTVLLFFFCLSAGSYAQYNTTVRSVFSTYGRFFPIDPLTKSVANKDGVINSFNDWENPRGRRFLFDEWAKGIVVDVSGNVINADTLLYNFDKESQSLIVTTNKKEIISVEPFHLLSVTLSSSHQSYRLERPAAIDRNKFYIALVKNDDKHYSLYKQPKIKLIPANYYNNGITETGHTYDEWAEEPVYYIVLPGGASKQVSTKSKAIKAILTAAEKKVSDYYKQKKSKDDEASLIALVEYLNQP